ncbi:MAG: hypothetical protein KJO16_09405 [Muriicola sp.]|nr:hypothetical protein [Muriicola sp.]MBT8282611.1 hypothetical protein [Muriicola sp.]NNK12179.1 hypothetical protein [Flavobacteriaceae bacterium]
MVSSYSVENKEDHLVIIVEGNYDYWEFLEYPHQILKTCKEYECDKVLVDLSSVKSEEIALIELFFLGEKIAKVLGKRVMLALIWKRESLSDFLVDVATNRSARLKVFDTVKRAEYWLLHKY